MIAWLNLRGDVPARTTAFKSGLERIGYVVNLDPAPQQPGARDILVTWNRVQSGRMAADRFESLGRPVIVAENASWGNSFAGRRWYHIARGRHNTNGAFPVGDASRWDNLGRELEPFRAHGTERVVLASRGIGAVGAMPLDWPERAARAYGARVRPHPGKGYGVPLDEDLANAKSVITWGSGAAITALMMGIPVVSEMPNWIGGQDNTEWGRRDMLRRLAWAQWQLDEIRSGEPFFRLLA